MNKGALFSPSKKDPEKLNVWSALIPVIFDITCGLLLLFLGKLALKITSYTLSGVMIVFGIWSSVSYFLSSPMEKITGSLLASGLALLFSGVLLAFNPDYLKDLLPFIWGLALLYGAFLKTQYAFDEKALNIERWWILLIFAGVSLVLGIISLLDPSFLGDKRETVIGILLIAEAILDIVVFLVIRNALKKAGPDSVTVPLDPLKDQKDPQAALTEGEAKEPEAPAKQD